MRSYFFSFICFFIFYLIGCAPSNLDKPKLVVVLVVDQMRPDLLTRFDKLYKGGFKLIVHHIPGAEVIIPIEVNTEYTKEKEQVLEDCIIDLINNQEHRIQSSISIDESIASRVG